MKIVNISDTHEHHTKVNPPEGDILIHAGDFTFNGDIPSVSQFMAWLKPLVPRYTYGIVFIAGNHDRSLDPDPWQSRKLYPLASQIVLEVEGAHYLNDSGIELGDMKIWGSPVQPEFCDWGFNRPRGPEIREHWDLIPEGTNILITHGPPWGMQDTSWAKGQNLGCSDLMEVVSKIKPKLHVFGHIHGGYGMKLSGETIFVNASVVNEAYQIVNAPVVVEL